METEGDAVPEPEEDLSTHRPGSELRAKADALRKEHPYRSLLARALKVHTDEQAWRRGSEGELEVARRLTKLGEGWHVIHGVPVGTKGSDIDHIVIGPGGVFTLNTKNHLGGRVAVTNKAVYVNGTYQPYLRNSRYEGKRASKLLTAACGHEVEVHPVIVIMADSLTINSLPPDVWTVGRKKVVKYLAARPVKLAPEQAKEIYEVARRPSTWVAGPGNETL